MATFSRPRSHLMPIAARLSRLPFWLLLCITLGLLMLWGFVRGDNYHIIFNAVRKGLGTTIRVSFIAYVLAMGLGLLLSLMRTHRSRVTQEVSSFYTEGMGGVPMMGLL